MLVQSYSPSQLAQPTASVQAGGARSPETAALATDRAHFRPVDPAEKAADPARLKRQTQASADANENKEQKAAAAEAREEKVEMARERRQISELATRDREVRAHEQAHMAVGGRYAGAASYEFERGPNGVNYAVGGEVPISTGKESTSELTILKAQIVRRAALAPAEPSPQDRQVAARATALEAEARKELANELRLKAAAKENQSQDQDAGNKANETNEVKQSNTSQASASPQDSNTLGSDGQSNRLSSLASPAPGSTGGRLIQSIINATPVATSPGSILDQIA